MIWAIRQLLVPLSYLRIREGDRFTQSKAVYDFALPGVLTVISVGLLSWLSVPLVISSHAALVASLSQLLGLLIAFYMAALAAVATFGRDTIDVPLKGGDATLMVRHHDGGHWVKRVLTYRQFICYLFGYLSFLSLVTFTALIFLQKVWPLLAEKAKPYVIWGPVTGVLTPVLFVLLFFAIWQLVVTSMLGIYFLSERMQSIQEPEN
jgi:hypothetical protein